MCTKIVDSSATRCGFCLPTSTCGYLGTISVEVCFKFDEPSQCVAFEQLDKGKEVGIPSPVLEGLLSMRNLDSPKSELTLIDCQETPGLPRNRNQFLGLLEGGREWLFHHN